MIEEKEQLEKKLRLLKESLESGIINADEYGQKRDSVEEELKHLEEKEKKEEAQKEEVAELKEEKQKEEIEIQEIKEDKLKEIEREKPQEKELKKEEIKEETKKEEAETIKEKKTEELQDKKRPDKKKKNKPIIFSIIILIILLIFYFSVFKETSKEPICISDDDCKKEGKIGICQNPDTEEAICIFKDPIEVNLTIINDKICISCDSSRMKQVTKQLFPGVKINEINYNSIEGKRLVDKFDIEVLPAYVFSANLDKTFNFNEVERTFIKKNSNYIMLPTATGANYFFKRAEIPNKLDLFVLPDEPDKNEKNLAEVMNLFDNNVIFEKHLVTEEKIKNELIITTYPTFLVNNKLKFTGIQSPELIKNKFCELNKLPECETKLSETLK